MAQTGEFVMRGFACTTDAMESARVCREAGLACRLTPRPAAMGNAECGTALRTAVADEERVARLLAQAGIIPTDTILQRDWM